VDNTCLIFGH